MIKLCRRNFSLPCRVLKRQKTININMVVIKKKPRVNKLLDTRNVSIKMYLNIQKK